MAYRNGNYAAFYVAEPFSPTALGAHATEDFCYYNLLRAWKGADLTFSFIDSHDKTYNVRDTSDWEKTLKPRLRERLQNSKNIILFLGINTLNSRALREELDYGINNLGLPVIVAYPGFNTAAEMLSNGSLARVIKDRWAKVPIFKDSMHKVPTLHVPMNKALIGKALGNNDFCVSTKTNPDFYWFKN